MYEAWNRRALLSVSNKAKQKKRKTEGGKLGVRVEVNHLCVRHMAADILFVVAEKLAQFLRVPNLSAAYSGFVGIETELRRVHELLKEDPGLEMNSKELKKWVGDLIHAAQNIEDIVDDFDFNVERRQQRKGCMSRAFLAVKDKVARHKIVTEIMQAKEKMGRICESMPKKQVFGFDKDFDALAKLLVEGNGPHPLYTFIVGPCGAGKTTLVKKVYDSDAVKMRFPYNFWLGGPVAIFWDCPAFWEKMTIKVTGCSQEHVRSITKIDMCGMIHDALKGKRYLIVLDINLGYPRYLDPRYFVSGIREAFPDERNGSRVVVSCNDKKDADLFGQEIEVHELGMLSSEEKWKLFLNTWDFNAATAETTAGTSLSSPMLYEIVRLQKHLPSEIVNLGALLSKENRKSSALSNILLDQYFYNFQVDDPERTLSKIASSLNLLESPLQMFCLYCSHFPKGFEIPTRRVIGQWLAAVLASRRGDEWFCLATGRLKNMGFIEVLSHLGMIQVDYSYFRRGYCREDCDFAGNRIRLGTPVWDFAAMKAMEYNLSHNNMDNEGPPDSRSSSSNARGLALHSSGIYDHIFHDQKVSLPNLRWLLCFPQLTVIGGEVTFSTSRFKLLRVLDLEDMYFITQLSQEIGELVHLRYLGLRRTGLYSLPNSIGNLRNLETLDIRGTRVKPIPTAIQKLKQLLHLHMDVDDGSTDDNDSLDVSSLRRIRVLSAIRVGAWMENGLGELEGLKDLGIYGDPLDYRHARQVTELELDSLRLGFGFGDIIPEDILPSSSKALSMWSLYLERPLQKLPGPDAFPMYLRRLCLKWSLLEHDPMATLERLTSLKVLKLRCGSFLGKKMVCSAGGFPDLEFLELSLLEGLEKWTVKYGAMPFLKHLVIRLCNRLKELPHGLMHRHGIQKLEVAGMPDTFNARLQYKKGDYWDKIKHIKSVTVDGIQMAASSSSSSSF